MIEFVAVACQNFLSFQNLPRTELKDQGLVFVRGRNMDDPDTDSNDSGKSNLFNLITWVLFEKLAKTGQAAVGDDVINCKAGKDCWGTVWLEIDGREYEITRSRNRKGYKNSAIITGALIAQGKRAANNEEIEKLLGMTYKMFLSSVFWAQGETTRRLTQLSDAEYKELFDELVGTAAFEQKRKKIAAAALKMTAELSTLGMQISQLEGSIMTAEEFIRAFDDAPAPEIDAQTLRTKYDAVCACYGEWEEIKRDWAEQVKISQDRDEWIRQKNVQLTNVQGRLDTLAAEAKKRTCSQCKQELKTKQAVQEIKNLEKELLEGVRKISDEISKLKKEKMAAGAKAMMLSGKDKRQGAEYNKLWEEIREMLPEQYKDMDIPSLLAAAEREVDTERLDLEKQKLAGMKEKQAELISQKADKQLELDRLEVLKRAYGPAGMKSMRLAELNPLLNQKAEEYSQLLAGGVLQITFNNLTETKGGELREKYSVAVKKDEGVNFRLSGGGMITRANLIAAFAVDEVRSMMKSQEVSLKIYDEPTEGLDASGESIVVELIRERLKGTSFFVSHRSIVGDNLSDHIWTVVRQDNISVLELR